MILKRQLSFRLRPSGKNNIVYLIQLHVTYRGYRLKISTGCKIDNPDAWSDKLQCVLSGYVGPNGETTLSINETIQKYRDEMDWTFKYYEVNDTTPTIDQISEKFNERIGGGNPVAPGQAALKPKDPSLFDVFDMYTEEVGKAKAWTDATYEKMSALRVDLVAFNPKLRFRDLTEPTLSRFVVYLRDEKVLHTPRKKKKDREDDDVDSMKGLRNSSIKKKLEYLRMFLNWATRRKYNTNLEYQDFRPTLKTSDGQRIYLTQEEMTRIWNLDLSSDNLAFLDPIRDFFMFACFSGLRYSDVNNLRKGDLKSDYFLSTNIKTGKTVRIDYNEVTTRILDKYKDFPFDGGKALPNYTNQALNRELKKLCRLAGINEEVERVTYKGAERHSERKPKWMLVGTHTGRHTFIVQGLSMGIPPNVIMQWTGHPSYKSMKPYVDIVDKIRAESMTKYNMLAPDKDKNKP